MLRPRLHDLVLPDGTRARVTAAGLVVGRRRSPSAAGSVSATPRLEIDDATRSLSRDHVRLVATDDGVVQVVDLGSGNGTTVERPDGTTTELVPGAPSALRAGDLLHLGATTASLVRSGQRRRTEHAGPHPTLPD